MFRVSNLKSLSHEGRYRKRLKGWKGFRVLKVLRLTLRKFVEGSCGENFRKVTSRVAPLNFQALIFPNLSNFSNLNLSTFRNRRVPRQETLRRRVHFRPSTFRPFNLSDLQTFRPFKISLPHPHAFSIPFLTFRMALMSFNGSPSIKQGLRFSGFNTSQPFVYPKESGVIHRSGDDPFHVRKSGVAKQFISRW